MGSNSSGAKKLGNVAINNALPLEATHVVIYFPFHINLLLPSHFYRCLRLTSHWQRTTTQKR